MVFLVDDHEVVRRGFIGALPNRNGRCSACSATV